MANWSAKSKCGSLLNRKTLPNASTTTTTPSRASTALSSASSLFKSVCLHDWWLIKPPDGQAGLAIEGFSSREGKTVRAFKSAAVSKRHDATTLETVDGFSIALVGFINKHLAHQNGFSPEGSNDRLSIRHGMLRTSKMLKLQGLSKSWVYSHFRFGFPYNWEEYTVKSSNEVLRIHTSDLAKHTYKTRTCNRKNDSRPESLDNLPVTGNHDMLMCSHRESDCHTLTMKAIDDLFECFSDLEHDDNSSSSEDNNANCSEVVKMASDKTQLTNSNTTDIDILGNSFQSESSSDLPRPRKLGHINRHQESGHIIPTKRKSSDSKVPEGSFLLERINSDSATAKMIVSAETPTVLKVDGSTSRTIGNKPAARRRITRSMTKEKN